MEDEVWTTIDVATNYEVSNYGRVRNTKNDNRVLKLQQRKSGRKRKTIPYFQAEIHIDGRNKKHKVHRLVAKAFIPNPDNKPYVDHIDRNHFNNHVSNLRWVYPYENSLNVEKVNAHYCIYPAQKDKFRIQIQRGGYIYHLGHHATIEEAIKVRDNFIAEYNASLKPNESPDNQS